jgi:methanogenic corrinoid protein MtbC1
MSREIAAELTAQKAALAEEMATRQYARYAWFDDEWLAQNPEHFAKGVRDIAYHVDYLAEAVAAGKSALFEDYVLWAKALFAGLNFSENMLPESLKIMHDVLRQRLTVDQFAAVNPILQAAMDKVPLAPDEPETFIHPEIGLSQLTEDYLAALLRGDRRAASGMIMNAVQNGTPIKQIYIDVFQAAQHEVGRLWQINKVSVAQEHYCTAATQLIMSQLYEYIFAEARVGRRMLATSVGGELHEIGIRMVTDFFEMEGWDTYFLGANSPLETILGAVEEQKPDVIAISATITRHVREVERLIGALRGSFNGSTPKIMVGGYPFNAAPTLWQQVGADATAGDANGAIRVATNLVG